MSREEPHALQCRSEPGAAEPPRKGFISHSVREARKILGKRSIGYLQKLQKNPITVSALQMLKKPHSLKHWIVRGLMCAFKGAGPVGGVHSFSWSLHSLWHV